MSESNETKTVYPIWSSCSFLATNFHEETSANLEEYCNLALIPERCCLLNDVIYPLDYIDEFYWTPWKSVEYDSEFLLKESEKVEEKLLKICTNVSPFDDTDVKFDEEFPEFDDLFDISQFKELKLQAPSDRDKYEFLEVPYICNHALQLKPEIPLEELLRNIRPMEIENIFERDHKLTFDKSFEENFLETESVFVDEFDDFPDNFERFKEIVLPKVPEVNLSLDLLSISPKRDDLILLSENAEQYDIKSENNTKEQINFNQNLISPCQGSYVAMPQSDDISYYKNSENNSIYLASESHGEVTVFDKNDRSDMQFADKSSSLNFNCELESSKIEEFNSSSFIYSNEDDCITNVKCYKEMDDNFSEICNDDFFSENFGDSSDFDDTLDIEEVQSNYVQNASAQNSIIFKNSENVNSSIQSSGNSFLEKLSKLDLAKNIPNNNNCIPKGNRTVSENILKCSTAFRNRDLKTNNEQVDKNKLEQTSRHQYSFENEIKTDVCQSQNSFNLLSSFLCAKKKENELPFESKISDFEASKNSFGEKNESSLNCLKILNNGVESYCEERSSTFRVESKLQLPQEDIAIKFPNDYIKLILVYENSVTFYIQKLAFWEKFKLPPDLTIVDISLDKTRFLLNQEVKNCCDRNINPLEGGVRYSHYIQLLVLHGILKSLNYLIHFGARLAISSLYEYETKHNGLLEGCFQHLIGETSTFIENLPETDSVHPKIKEMSIYLQQKYYFCKENMIAFKVLIILKEHLNFFYSAFEAYMKTFLPEIIIDMIPESYYLDQETDYFSKNEEQIYVVCVSSISKSITWKNLTFIIEYQTDKNVCWKNVCEKENVSHVHIIFDSLPLKTLNGIQNLPALKDPPCKKSSEVKEIPIVVSTSISLKYNLKSLFLLEQNVSIIERDYKKHLPDMHFADVGIDYRTSITIIHLKEFLSENILENLIQKIFSMHLKYEVCWIIIYGDLSHKSFDKDCCHKIQETFTKFYFSVIAMKSQQCFKVKFLYGECNEDIKKCIASILSKNLKCLLFKSGNFPVCSFTTDMTKEELFMVSFPSFNPFIASFILSSKIPLFQLMNLKLEDLFKKFHSVPERFLKHFYLFIHESANLSLSSKNFEGNVYRNLVKSDEICRTDSNCTKKLNANSNELVKFITYLEKYYSFEDRLMTNFTAETLENESNNCKIPVTNCYSKMSVEEIDRNYRALEVKDTAYAAFDIGFENNFDCTNTQSTVKSHTSSKHSVSSDSISPVDNDLLKLNSPTLKKRKYDNFVSQGELNICMEESQIYYSSKLKSPKNIYQKPVGKYVSYKCDSFDDTEHTLQLLEDEKASLQNVQMRKLSTSEYDNLILQNDMNNICFEDNMISYSSEGNNSKKFSYSSEGNNSKNFCQTLNYPANNDLLYKSNPSDEANHCTWLLENGSSSLQAVLEKKSNLPQYNNKLVSRNDLDKIYIGGSQTYYSNESRSNNDPFQNLKYSAGNHLPFEETNDASQCLGDTNANLENIQVKQFNLSQYRFKKRKNADFSLMNQNKFRKYSQNLCTSPRLQKGQSSKTVCKQVTFKSSPIGCITENNDFSPSYNGLYSNASSQTQLSKKHPDMSSDFSQRSNRISYEDIDSSWMSQSVLTLTPRTSRRLAYEKIPGMKGQTRLIFH